MTDPSQAEIDGATAYETLFVRALFGPWVEPVLARAAVASGMHVLDVACGTGVLARGALHQVGPTGSVTGLDPNAGMLAVATRLEPGVRWQHGMAEAMPFDDARFDRVVSQFGLMFFQDREQAVREMARVVVAGGRLVVVVWDEAARIPPYATAIDLLDRVAGPEAAAALRAPFALGDRQELGALFDRAGVPNYSITTVENRATFPSIRAMVEADLRGWLPVMGVELDEERIARVLGEAEPALRRFVTWAGAFEFPTSAHIVTAEKA